MSTSVADPDHLALEGCFTRAIKYIKSSAIIQVKQAAGNKMFKGAGAR
jgi:hypothetical protein